MSLSHFAGKAHFYELISMTVLPADFCRRIIIEDSGMETICFMCFLVNKYRKGSEFPFGCDKITSK